MGEKHIIIPRLPLPVAIRLMGTSTTACRSVGPSVQFSSEEQDILVRIDLSSLHTFHLTLSSSSFPPPPPPIPPVPPPPLLLFP